MCIIALHKAEDRCLIFPDVSSSLLHMSLNYSEIRCPPLCRTEGRRCLPAEGCEAPCSEMLQKAECVPGCNVGG